MVIFDCDGVLVDSEVIAIDVDRRILAEAGVDVTFDELAELTVGLSATAVTALVRDRYGVVWDDAVAARRSRELFETFEAGLQPVAGIDHVLRSLSGARCVASSSSRDRIDRSLARCGLDELVGPHRFSATQVQRGKPAPDLFLLAARQMGVTPEQCVVVEDSIPGVRAAVAAGMAVIGFTAGSHCAGAHEERLADTGAGLVAASWSELLSHLARFAG